MKAQRLLRMLRTGEVCPFRSVLLLPMGLATFRCDVAPRAIDRSVPAVKSAVWSRGALELCVKLFGEEPGADYATARRLARELRAIRRTGVSLRGLRVKPYRHRERKAQLGRFKTAT